MVHRSPSFSSRPQREIQRKAMDGFEAQGKPLCKSNPHFVQLLSGQPLQQTQVLGNSACCSTRERWTEVKHMVGKNIKFTVQYNHHVKYSVNMSNIRLNKYEYIFCTWQPFHALWQIPPGKKMQYRTHKASSKNQWKSLPHLSSNRRVCPRDKEMIPWRPQPHWTKKGTERPHDLLYTAIISGQCKH